MAWQAPGGTWEGGFLGFAKLLPVSCVPALPSVFEPDKAAFAKALFRHLEKLIGFRSLWKSSFAQLCHRSDRLWKRPAQCPPSASLQ